MARNSSLLHNEDLTSLEEPAISLRGVTKEYEMGAVKVHALERVSLSVPRGNHRCPLSELSSLRFVRMISLAKVTKERVS